MSERAKWLHDVISPDLVELHSIRRVIYCGKTKFQDVDILETGSYGLCLVLDGKIQSSERDEFVYHDGLVHPALIAHPDPRSVFIAGGGEGATLREVLNHRTVKRAVMVDIDAEVVDLARRYLTGWHQGAFDDPRTELHCTDARKYLEDTTEKFDAMVLDLPDPLEGGPAFMLFTKEFYATVRRRLSPGGIISVQAGAASWANHKTFCAVVNTLKTVFEIVRPCAVHVPSFTDVWGFACASQKLDPAALDPEEVDRRIAARCARLPGSYDGPAHRAMFSLPKHIRGKVAATRRVISDAKPMYTF